MDEAGTAAAAANGGSRRGSGEMSRWRRRVRGWVGTARVAGRSKYSGGDMGGAVSASGISMRLGTGGAHEARPVTVVPKRRGCVKVGQAHGPAARSLAPPPRVRTCQVPRSRRGLLRCSACDECCLLHCRWGRLLRFPACCHQEV